MEIAVRLSRLRDRLDAGGHRAALVSNLTNIGYLTGFTGSAGLLAVLPDDALLVTDGRYRDQSSDQIAAAGVEARVEITSVGQGEIMAKAFDGMEEIAVEAESITWAQQRKWSAEWLPGQTLTPTEGLVEDLRRRKDPGEVARIEAAAGIADEALGTLRHRLLEEPAERDFALDLDFTMRRLGADDVSFETICASGENGSKPHARPGPRQIWWGDLVVIDFGALVDGYHSDMTRSFLVGEGTETQKRMLSVVADSQRAGVEVVAPGVGCSDVDRAAREVIDDAGWDDAFLHSTGHGVGLDIHEAPRVAATSEHVLEVGEVVTVEPGVYLPDHGGVRIEDTLLVMHEGSRPLTKAPKDTSPG